jgi:transposase
MVALQHAAEFGLVVAKGIQRVPELRTLIAAADVDIMPLARSALLMLATQIEAVNDRVLALEQRLMALHRASANSRRLATIPGIGPITATAIVATMSDAAQFGSARQFAAWIGLVPKQHSSGGRERMGGSQQAGASPARAWRQGGDPLAAEAQSPTPAVARCTSRAPAHKCRGRRAR